MNPETSPADIESAPPPLAPGGRGHRLSGRQIAIFATIILAILLTATTFVCTTWGFFWQGAAVRKWQIVPFLLSVLFVPTTIIGLRRSDPVLRFLYRISSVWVGVLSFCVFAAAASWIVLGIVNLAGLDISRRAIGAPLFAIVALLSIYGIVNASRIRIRRIDVELPNLPEAWRERRAALVTDLHLGNLNGAHFAAHVVSRIQRLGPDVVFISGDLFDGTQTHLDRLAAPLKRLRAPLGVYFVTGNHEEFTNREQYTKVVEQLGIRVLNNEKVAIENVQVVGVHDGEASEPELFRYFLKSADLDPDRPSILLAHQPANLRIAEEAGISLQLSGHTHRGQFWPWTLIASRVYGRFAYGLNRVGNLMVYTSSGVGTWGPPLRIGTQPEIVLLRFL
ncbi:MAG TPA: metallophosphoesterase [Chthoniobacterales bacterium]